MELYTRLHVLQAMFLSLFLFLGFFFFQFIYLLHRHDERVS